MLTFKSLIDKVKALASQSRGAECPLTLSEQIDRLTQERLDKGDNVLQDVWDRNPDDQRFVLSRAESLVLDMDPEVWPRCSVVLDAWEAVTDFGDSGFFTAESLEAARRERPDIPLDTESVECFAEFAHHFGGLTTREAYQAWYKWELWHLRMKYLYHVTCTDEASTTQRMRRLRPSADVRRDDIEWLQGSLRSVWAWGKSGETHPLDVHAADILSCLRGYTAAPLPDDPQGEKQPPSIVELS